MTTTRVLQDRCKLPTAFWQAIEQLGLPPSAVLRQASLPASLHLNHTAFISTPQLFAIWNAIETLSGDPAFGIRMVRDTSSARHMMAFVTALYAADFRDGLARIVRYKRLCSPDRLQLEEKNGKLSVTGRWPGGTEAEPLLSVVSSFALVLELGRRGTGQQIVPLKVDLRHRPHTTELHAAYFGCPIKAALRRAFAGGQSDVASVARELSLSERTLQRRLREEGLTFRFLLDETRQQLGRQLLADLTLDVEEVAFLLAYQNTNSFHRAFKSREQVTPGQWRRMNSPA